MRIGVSVSDHWLQMIKCEGGRGAIRIDVSVGEAERFGSEDLVSREMA